MIITVAMQKGGTGKSTTAAALIQAGVNHGLKVLAIDLDTQANLTYFLKGKQTKKGAYDLLISGVGADSIQKTPQGVYLAPASFQLSTLKTGTGSARRLEKALTPLKEKYDLIVIDTPPTINELQYNALQTADFVIIPLQATVSGLQGLMQIAETIKAMQKSNPKLKAGVLFTAHNSRANITKRMVELITNKAQENGFISLQAIRQGIVIQEAQALQENIFDYAPNSNPVIDYGLLYKQITEL